MFSRDGSLPVHAGHPDRGVAHDVDDELVGVGQLGAHRQPEREPELRRVAPGEVAPRRRRPPEHAIGCRATVPGLVGQDRRRPGRARPQLAEHPVAGDRRRVRRRRAGSNSASQSSRSAVDRRPRSRCRAPLASAPTRPRSSSARCGEEQLRVGVDRHVGVVGLVQVARVVRDVDEDLARRDRRREASCWLRLEPTARIASDDSRKWRITGLSL